MAKESIKEYGTDLLKQFKELQKQQNTLRNKVVKKFKFLLDNSDDPYLTGFTKEGTSEYDTDMMIFVIMRVEQNYVNQTTQLDMFNNQPEPIDNVVTGYDEEGHPLNKDGRIINL